jgi:hypothetical protein
MASCSPQVNPASRSVKSTLPLRHGALPSRFRHAFGNLIERCQLRTSARLPRHGANQLDGAKLRIDNNHAGRMAKEIEYGTVVDAPREQAACAFMRAGLRFWCILA